jgi:predicted RNase H-like nuclease (RuvC/YqgF family)
MSKIKREIESLKAKIARLEAEQKKAELEKKALTNASSQIDKILKDNGINFEIFVRHNYKRVKRIVQKLEGQAENANAKTKPSTKRKSTRKGRGNTKTVATIKIPAGRYGNLPNNPDQIFEVKEKGPRPKLLKGYAQEVGLKVFMSQCRLD